MEGVEGMANGKLQDGELDAFKAEGKVGDQSNRRKVSMKVVQVAD